MPFLDFSQVFIHSVFQEQDRLVPPAATYPHRSCGELEQKKHRLNFLGEKILVLTEILYTCVAIKPLTPLAAINTIATQHPSQHFLVGYTALLTSLTPGAEGKHRELLISQGLPSLSAGAQQPLPTGWEGLSALPELWGCPGHCPTLGTHTVRTCWTGAVLMFP